MPETKEIEVFVGKEGTPGADPAKSGKTTPTKPEDAAEVSGRDLYNRLMECWYCHRLSWIVYDTDAFHDYICCHCGRDNVL